jgi:hypothetical protein
VKSCVRLDKKEFSLPGALVEVVYLAREGTQSGGSVRLKRPMRRKGLQHSRLAGGSVRLKRLMRLKGLPLAIGAKKVCALSAISPPKWLSR